MRIISGIAKGRSLSSVAGPTRPTSDRAREGLFSSLLSEFGDFVGLSVLDLFAGSGAIGLEALSRGASIVAAVEQDASASKTITKNAELVNSAGPAGKFALHSMSVESFIDSASPISYDVIFIDPPYELPASEIAALLEKALLRGFISSSCVIAVERDAKSDKFRWPTGLSAMRERNYGQAVIYYGTPASV
jgi:16S rRNA (guanine966-N2)-methyltransferase